MLRALRPGSASTSVSIGRNVSKERALEIGRLGEKHGFRVEALLHGGRLVAQRKIDSIAAIRKRRSDSPEASRARARAS